MAVSAVPLPAISNLLFEGIGFLWFIKMSLLPRQNRISRACFGNHTGG